jgi:hypothetical protein
MGNLLTPALHKGVEEREKTRRFPCMCQPWAVREFLVSKFLILFNELFLPLEL